MTKRAAIIGAGIQGVCAALELARRGVSVDLFDKSSEPLRAASLWNEGKIHLGFLFANDPSLRTAKLLIEGAFSFGPLLARWTSCPPERLLQAKPFQYLVPRDSMLDDAAVECHFDAVGRLIEAAPDRFGHCYLGKALHGPFYQRLETPTRDRDAGPRALFQTPETSIDPHQVRSILVAALDESEAIRFNGGIKIDAVVQQDDLAYALIGPAGDRPSAVYDYVVNASWEDRLRLDATIGLTETRPWLHRYKYALHVFGYDGPALGSSTMMLGPYGDIVEFESGRLYLSWYPVCRTGSWTDISPPEVPQTLGPEAKRDMVRNVLGGLARHHSAIGKIDLSRARVNVAGGYIFSWGATDVSDPSGEIHNRFDSGIRRLGNYFSIDTGKYSMAPLFASQLGEQIER